MNKLILMIAVLFIQACAFTDATLKVAHDPDVNIKGPMSQVQGISFTSPRLEDARLDKARIGWKKNGFGANTAEITSEQPVNVIVERAIIDAIRDNGHMLAENGQVAITGTVDRFWFETDVNFWTVEFIGDVQCSLDFIDSASNTSIYKSSYSGTYKEKKAGGLEKTWTEVLGKAVDNLIEDIVFDEDLTEALERYK